MKCIPLRREKVTFSALLRTLTPREVLDRLNQGLWPAEHKHIILSIIGGRIDQERLRRMEDEAQIQNVRLVCDEQGGVEHEVIYANPFCPRDTLVFLDFCYSGQAGRLVLASRCPVCGNWAFAPAFCGEECRERFIRERRAGVVNLFAAWAPG